MPLSATQSSSRATSSSSSRKRRRTGSRSVRSSTCEAVSRWPASSSSRATTPSTGLVWRSERSASRTRRSGGRSSSGSSSSSSGALSPAPNVAWISGANASMSGHITTTSRGSSVGSAASRCRIASRTTSTWRARPWQAWTWMLASVSPGSSGRSSRTAAWTRASSVPDRCSTGCSCDAASGPITSCSSRESCPQEASSRFSGSRAVSSSARRVTRGARAAIFSHSAGDGCRRNRWTSRCSASARRTCSWPAGSRVSPNSENRSGSSASPGSARSRAQALSPRAAGSGSRIRAFSRRHSSACQWPSSPAAQPRTSSGRCSA